VRRFLGFLGIVVVLAAIGVGGFFAVEQLSETDGADEGEQGEEVELERASVVRTDLVERETLEGTLRFTDPGTISSQAAGTVTALPEPGDVVERGDTVYEVNGAPVVLLYGDRPAWRALSDSSDDGVDVQQLEENLVALGFDEDGEMTVDEEYTGTTAEVVEAWQASLGLEETGVVDLGAALFLPGPIRVGELWTDVGATVGPGTPVVATSSSEQEIVVLLPADRQDLLGEGDAVTVELPDGSRVGARVREVGRIVLAAGPEGDGVIEVFIDLDDPSLAGGLDQAPVEVDVVSDRATGVLAVPVNALIALAEGGYAVEVVQGSQSQLVGVEIGEFADGLVEVAGNIAEGDVVLVPK
jgi:peptidoglycan hydrolase-like protein with peptidoglycan-binding domain